MYRCPEHGLTFFQLCCEHIADAVDANRPEQARMVIDGADSAVITCGLCHPMMSSFEGDSLQWSAVKIVPICGDHAEAWYATMGEGNLLASIAKAKSDHESSRD